MFSISPNTLCAFSSSTERVVHMLLQRRKLITQISLFAITKTPFSSSSSSIKPLTTSLDFPYDDVENPLYADVPKPRKDKSERKPYPTPMKELIRRAKEEKALRRSQPCRVLEDPPDNGLLVPELVHVAHGVHRRRSSLLSGLSRIVHRHVSVHRCRLTISFVLTVLYTNMYHHHLRERLQSVLD